MGMVLLTERYADRIRGVLTCFDRIIITGTLPDICHANAMAIHLRVKGVRLFDFARWAEPLRDEIRNHAERVAQDSGLQIEFVRKKNFRQEARIKQILAERGTAPGLVHIFSALEPCLSFKPWHDKKTGRNFLKPDDGKCIHYYFYFIDEELGLCYLRVPTWAPFRLQFYFNGHNALAVKLARQGIAYQLVDNAFIDIADFPRAQVLADQIRVEKLHRRLHRLARRFCPVLRHFPSGVHWSIHQAENATDIVFKHPDDLKPLYEALVRTAIHAVKAEDVATFLGRVLRAGTTDEIGNHFSTRIEGTRIRHQMGPASIKMYDKFGLMIRIETTTYDVSFFRHYRQVEHRNGSAEMKYTTMKKTIYSLPALNELTTAANHRYLKFLSTLDDPTSGAKALEKLSAPVREADRTWRGFNLFDAEDLRLFEVLLRGEFNISGFRNRTLRSFLTSKTAPQLSRILKRLRCHGLIKKVARNYKYHLTALGRAVASLALQLRAFLVTPTLAQLVPAGS
jgi:hypothetical protein